MPEQKETWLQADGQHHIHYWLLGSPEGMPALVLHGGPGSSSSPRLTAPFDLEVWRVLGFDQRGCGASTPLGEIADNTTDDLIRDIEEMRKRLGIASWFVAGGSWGATLAVAYAAQHSLRVTGLFLRNPFLGNVDEVEAFFERVKNCDNEIFAKFLETLPGVSEKCMAEALNAVLADRCGPRRAWDTACMWQRCEALIAREHGKKLVIPVFGSPEARCMVARYRVQAHYLAHGCFLGKDGLLGMARKLCDVPTMIVQGAEDAVCPIENAHKLHKAISGSRMRIVPDAGHDPFHPDLLRVSREAIAQFAMNGRFF